MATGLNALLIGVVFGGTVFQLFVMPFLFRSVGLYAAWFLLPIMLLQPLHWGLIHEAIHSHLLPRRKAEEFWARLLSVMHWLPFDATRYCHLVHHRFSRHAYDRADQYRGGGSYVLAWLRFRLRLLGGAYLGVLISPLIAFLPLARGSRVMSDAVPLVETGDTEVRRLFVALVHDPRKRRRTRREFALSLVLYAASAWAYGAWWPMLIATMYVRGVWHSIADNLAHHDVSLDEPERARNYRLPRPLGFLLMNHHLHLTHHRHPTAPWRRLARLSAADEVTSSDAYFHAAFRQFGSIYPRIAASEG
ncbi:MAG: fatty acid desaturase [Alphaproteobacteria bacterium]|nr:fatty acid desaturase [Alphaproteobacteria bacterium]